MHEQYVKELAIWRDMDGTFPSSNITSWNASWAAEQHLRTLYHTNGYTRTSALMAADTIAQLVVAAFKLMSKCGKSISALQKH
jgi:hypothetical protein